MRSFLNILIVLICSSTNVLSTDHFWIGGIGDWDDGSNWSHSVNGFSCNCVPKSNDHVEITGSSGMIICTIPNGYEASVESVDVQNSTTLRIGSLFGGGIGDARLVIDDSQFEAGIGLKIDGTVEVYDSLLVFDAANSGIHIRPAGTLNIYSGGLALVGVEDGLCERGILNQNSLNIYRNSSNIPGELIISNIMGDGIFNFSTSLMYNNGMVQISNLNFTGIFEEIAGILLNKSDFQNDTSGVVLIQDINLGSDGSGIQILDSSSLINDGCITIQNVEIGLNLKQSKFFIDTGYREIINRGKIELTNSISLGIVLSPPAILDNYGEINVHELDAFEITAIENKGMINNNINGDIIINSLNDFLGFSIGIDNHNSFNNEGNIDMSDLGQGLSNSGDFKNFNFVHIDSSSFAIHNNDKGQLINHDSIILLNPSDLGINISDSSIFDNHGLTILQSSMGNFFTAIFIDNGSKAINHTMAQILFKDLSGLHGITVNDALLDNSGLIEYQNSTFSSSFINIVPGTLDIKQGAELIIGN